LRPKSPRRKNFELSVKELFARHDLNPIEEFIKLLRETKIDPDTGEEVPSLKNEERIAVLRELAQYHSPKLKATEVRGGTQNTLTIKVLGFGQQAALPEKANIITIDPKQIVEASEDGDSPTP